MNDKHNLYHGYVRQIRDGRWEWEVRWEAETPIAGGDNERVVDVGIPLASEERARAFAKDSAERLNGGLAAGDWQPA